MLLRDNVYENLRSDILTCRLAPGDDMREQELAERYAVSRQPVREALLRLEREHLVTVQPRQGYRVNPISLSDARDVLRFRLALEPACVAEAIENATAEVLRRSTSTGASKATTRTSSPTTAAFIPRWRMPRATAAWRRRCAT